MDKKLKNVLIIVALALACIAVVPISFLMNNDSVANSVPSSNDDSTMRGVWVASVFNLDYPSKKGMTSEELMSYADSIIDNCSLAGINNIFLQVRPCSDALYDSDIFPWSSYITGTQGTAPDNNFDPLKYWIKKAHEKNIKIQAWINPYRITKLTSDYDSLSPDNPAFQHPDWVVEYDSNYYYDPAIPEVRQLVVDGALEIVKKYDVDGIHLDDYFYPGTDFNDAKSFAEYNPDAIADLGDWRRNNVNLLIKELDTQIHKKDPKLSFGISCIGIWANKTTSDLGSDTAGYESYSAVYGDSREWIKNGWVDYIAPQIYWNMGYEKADYNILADWWANTVSGTDVKLYIGLADYRSGDPDPASAWYGTEEINRQLTYNEQNPAISGDIHFRYTSLISVQGLMGVLQSHYLKSDQIRFNDLAGAEWAQSYIYKLSDAGIVSGYEDGTFRPLGNVKRSEYLKLVIEAFGIKQAPEEFASNLSDLSSAFWYYNYLRTAEYNEILPKGTTNAKPEDYITREDMAYFAYRAAQAAGKSLPKASQDEDTLFTDDVSIRKDASEAVYSLAAAGVINGYEDKTYKPSGFATRAEASKIICALLDYKA